MPNTYTRTEIGLVSARSGPGRMNPDDVQGIALHWPAMSRPLSGVDNVKSALRSWQAFHMNTNGWSDIAYQEAIDQDGNVYELRGLSIQPGANGNTDVNEDFGALLLVVAPGEKLSEALIDAVRRRVSRHRELFPDSHLIVGHNQIRPEPTLCPGPIVSDHIAAATFEPVDKPKPTRGKSIDAALATGFKRSLALKKAIEAHKKLGAEKRVEILQQILQANRDSQRLLRETFQLKDRS